MKIRTPLISIGVAVLLLTTAFLALQPALAAETPSGDAVSLAEREKAVDKEHLLKIFAAVQAYQKDQGKLPAYLSDLFPKYLKDPELLMSPVEKRTGRSSLFGYGDPKMKSSYIYEFSGVSSGRSHEEGKTLTMQEWKTIQMESFGPVIPILRCHLHSPVLNVAYSGDLYETATLWESDPNTLALAQKLGPGKGAKSGKMLAVKVVSAENEAPLAGAQVTTSNLDTALGVLPPRTVTTGEQGQAELPLGTARVRQLTLTVTKPGYATAKASWGADSLPATVTIPLSRAITLGGYVKDQSGQPIAEGRVTVCGITRDEVGQSIEVEYETVVTDSQGRWEFSAAPANQEFITLRVKHAHFMPAEYNMAAESNAEEKLLAKKDLVAAQATLVLEPGIRVEGMVKQGENQPLADATVVLHYGENFANQRITRTDAQGHYLLVMLETCPAHLVAQAKGYAPKSQFITVERGLKPAPFELNKGFTLKGYTVDKDNRVLPGVHIRLNAWNDLSLLEWQTQTDAEGRFAWDCAPQGTLVLEAQLGDYYPAVQRVNMSAEARIAFKLDKQWRVTGTAKDAETGQPIDKFRVIRGYSYGGSDDAQMYWENQETVQGVKGAYTVTQSYRRGGRIKLMILAEGYLPAETPLIDDQGWHTHHFVLKKGAGPKGLVVLPSGAPAQGAQVALVGMGYLSLGKAAFRSSSDVNEFIARTDVEGRFSLPAVLASPTLIAVHEQGYAELTSDELAKSGKIILQPWAKVEGVLMFGTHAAPNESVMIAPETSGSSRVNYDWENFRVITDERGCFAFNWVPPGERRIVRLIQTSQNSWSWSHSEPLVVKPGETLKMTYGGQGRPVIGKVSLSDPAREIDWKNGHYSLSSPHPQPPKPLRDNEAWRVWNNSPEYKAAMRLHRSYSFQVNEDGTFRAENVPAGKYTLNFDVRESEGNQPGMGRSIGNLRKDVIVPEIPGGVSDEPMDLGKLVIQIRETNVKR